MKVGARAAASMFISDGYDYDDNLRFFFLDLAIHADRAEAGIEALLARSSPRTGGP